MHYDKLPEDIKDYYESMSMDEQSAFIACLARNKKQVKYAIKAKPEVKVLAPILAYISKHKVKHEISKRGNLVIFTFPSMEVRNKVLLGRFTL